MLNSTKTWQEKFDEYKLEECGKWKIDRVFAKQFISDLIAQTREETIREVIDKVRRHYDDLSILDFIENEERKLNKLKK